MDLRRACRWLALPALAFISSYALAQSTFPPGQPGQPTDCGGAECNAGGSSGITATQQQGTVIAPLLAISDAAAMSLRQAGGFGPTRLSSRPETGLAGAAQGSRWGLWAALAQTGVDYRFAPLASEGDINSYILGGDYRLTDTLVLGISVAVDDTRIDTRYNGGRLTGRGYNIAPYLGWQITEAWSLDATIGIGRADVDVVDNLALAHGSTDSSRAFGALNLNYSRWRGNWEFAGKATLLQSEEDRDAFSMSNGLLVPESVTRLGQLRILGQVSYLTAAGFNPYVSVGYAHDYQSTAQVSVNGQTPLNEHSGWIYVAGVNFYSKGAMSAGLRYEVQDRDEQAISLLMLNVALRF